MREHCKTRRIQTQSERLTLSTTPLQLGRDATSTEAP